MGRKENKMLECGVCHKSLSEGETSIIAVSISFINSLSDDQKYNTLIRRQFGAFDPEKTYYLCYECWLRSLGFKPDVV